MQSDAFPTPPIFVHHFQPRLVQPDLDERFNPPQDSHLNHLLAQIELLMTDCSTEESKSFWSATDQIKIKHRVIESMQKIESLFLDLARDSIQDPDLISAVSESLLYTSNLSMSSQSQIDVPNFIKPRLY
jgi:hypothetical protein